MTFKPEEEAAVEVKEMMWWISAASVGRSPWHLFRKTEKFLLNDSFRFRT